MTTPFVQSVRQPFDDLFQSRQRALAGRRAKCRVGGEQNRLAMGNRCAAANLPQRDDIRLDAAERGPVPPGVFQQLVRSGQPQGPAVAPQPLIENDPGNLPTLAAAGAVAKHPAAPQAHGR